MRSKLVRFALMAAVLSGMVGVAAGATAKDASFVFAGSLPGGVAFQTLVVAAATEFRFHAPGVVLERDRLDCSQATGNLFLKEQLLFVEWGEADIRDWTTHKKIASLKAGDSYGPTDDEQHVYLVGSTGREASVLRFGTTAASVGDMRQLPDVAVKTSGCHSGSGGSAPVQPADVTTLVSMSGEQAPEFAPGAEYTMYVGLLTVEAGHGFVANDGATAFTSTGSAIFAPLVGGLGHGASGGVGYGQAAPGPGLALFPGMPLGGLVNEGGWPVTILVAGTAPSGQPALERTQQ